MTKVRTYADWKAGLPFRLRVVAVFIFFGLLGIGIASLVTGSGAIIAGAGTASAVGGFFAVYWKALKSEGESD